MVAIRLHWAPLWYLAYEFVTPDRVRRASAGATVNDWMKSVKSNGRVEVPVNVLELARRDFFAGVFRMSRFVVLRDQMTSLNSLWPRFSDAPNDNISLVAPRTSRIRIRR